MQCGTAAPHAVHVDPEARGITALVSFISAYARSMPDPRLVSKPVDSFATLLGLVPPVFCDLVEGQARAIPWL